MSSLGDVKGTLTGETSPFPGLPITWLVALRSVTGRLRPSVVRKTISSRGGMGERRWMAMASKEEQVRNLFLDWLYEMR